MNKQIIEGHATDKAFTDKPEPRYSLFPVVRPGFKPMPLLYEPCVFNVQYAVGSGLFVVHLVLLVDSV